MGGLRLKVGVCFFFYKGQRWLMWMNLKNVLKNNRGGEMKK